MTHLDFTVALIRLSKYKIGPLEAAMLFCCKDGVSADTVAKILKTSKKIIWARGNILRSKKLIKTESDKNWNKTYVLTDKGIDIINNTLKPIKK